MNFRDRTLVSLASPDLRAALLSNIALSTIASTAYRLDVGMLSPPWSVVFDRLDIAPSFETQEQSRAEMAFDSTTGRIEGRIERTLPDALGDGPDAIWQGAVVGQGRLGGGHVAEVSGQFVGLGLVDLVIDGAGGIPASGAARDDARRVEIARRLSQASGVAGSIPPQDVTDWITRSGAADIGTFLRENASVDIGGSFNIRFVSDAPAADVAIRLEVDAVVHIADPDPNEASLIAMIRATHRARAQFSASYAPSAASEGVDRRVSVLGLWLAPLGWFNDQDWPGASPAARRDAANVWLREMGIAIAVPA